MVIDIQRKVIQVQMRRFITLVVFAISIIAIMLMGSTKNDFLGLSKNQWALILCAIYLANIIYEALLEMHYIYFSNVGDLIVLRFFSLGFFNKEKKVIQIPKDVFAGYILIKSLGGLKTKIIMQQRLKKKSVNYPPVCLSALSKKQIMEIRDILDRTIK